MSVTKSASRRATRLLMAVSAVMVLVLALAGVVSALTAGNVDGVWGDPPGSNPTDFRWCYADDNPTGPAGAPDGCSTSNQDIQNPPDSTTTDENQVRYGEPTSGSGSANRSGFGFNGNNNVGSIPADTPFYLGRFTHYNRPITADNVLTDITLDVTELSILCDDDSVPSEGPTQTFTYDFTLDETPNNADPCPYGDSTGNGCDDKVTVSTQPDASFTCPEGIRTVKILGFVEGAGCEQAYTPPVINEFVTGEGQENEACLWAEISEPEPLAVTLAWLEAKGQADRVVVMWETVSELQNMGFNLYRGTDSEGYERINAELIPSQAPDSAQGFVYEFDDLDVTSGQTYWYHLEAVDISGNASMLDSTSVTFTALSKRVWMPMIAK